ncbi:MAG: hypothetical protein LBM60_07985 [Clostridium sp.]|jgi:hypothetical protein|nr:hypothetical protein [Clostridium sp.]
MDGQKEWIVDGFAFYDEQTAQLAWQERRKIEYLEKHMDMEDSLPEDIRIVYEKLIHDRMFQTPIGIRYLEHLQALLRMSESIDDEEIEPIPLHIYYETIKKQEDSFEQNVMDQATKDTSVHNEESEINDRRADADTTKKLNSQKRLLQRLVIVNIALIVAVLGMFFIALSGKQPNILNYERVLQNRYASWEQNLTQLETQLRQKELELQRYE